MKRTPALLAGRSRRLPFLRLRPHLRRQTLRRNALALHRPAARRTHQIRPGDRRAAQRLLHRRVQRRHLEDHRLRPHLEPHLRRPAHRLHRLARHRALQSQHHLRRQRRRTAAPRPLHRRRRLQIHRRRQDLDPSRPARRPADPADRRRSAQPRQALRRRPRPPLRTQRRARPLPLHRWRPVLHRRSSARTKTPAPAKSRSIPRNPDIVYAALWEARQGPWENSAWNGPGGGIFKSTDGGTTWRPLTNGIPSGADGFIQANIAISPSNTSRLYASIATSNGIGIYRSDDAGEHWARATTDARPAGRIGGGDLSVPTVDPKNPDTVYVASTVTWKSTDGGKTWTGFRGAPGGDDYQRIWINPNNPDIILIVSDQGAIITVNGGETWSSWYNQPTAQMYHVNADNDFPYRVCSGQQESGSACISSRGNYGQLTFREWTPVGVEEYGYAVPDPLDPNIVFGGKVTRFDRRTGQVENVAPKPIRGPDYRTLRTAPVVFSQADPHVMFFAANTVFRTADGGRSWKEISPDLTRKTWEIPASVGKYRDQPTAQPTQKGVIYTIAPAPTDINRIWAGTDDGLIHTDRRWRPPLERRHPAGNRTLDENLHPRRRPLRRPHRLRRRQHPPPRRPAPPHLPHPRWRQDVDRNRQRHSRWRARRRGPRRSQDQGPALRRHRARNLRQLRRWRPLAVPAPQHARQFHPRSDRPRRRPHRRHPRTRLLDPRRHHAAPPAQRRRSPPATPSSSSRRPPSACAGT